jgi:MFS family permease
MASIIGKYSGALALIALSLAGFTASFTGHLITSNLGNYMSSFGSDLTIVGLVVGSIAMAEIVFNTPFGMLSDRYGRLKFILGGLAALVIVSLLFPYFTNPLALFALRFMQGMAIAAFSAASSASVAAMFTDKKGEAMGIYNSFKGAGYALGPMLGLFVTQYFNFFDTFLLCAVTSAITLILCLVLLKEGPGTLESNKQRAGIVLRDSNRLDYISSYFIGMSGMLVFYSIVAFLPVYGTRSGITPDVVGIILGIQAVVYVFAQYLFGKFSDNHGPRLPILVGTVLLTAGVLLIALFPSPVVWGFAVIMSGLGISALWVISNSYLAYAAPTAILGTVMGLSGAFKEVGDGGGPILTGFLGDTLGLRSAFLLLIAFLAVSFVLAFTLDDKAGQKRKAAKSEETIKIKAR